MVHLYEYFGTLLGCSLQSDTPTGTFPVYTGAGSMYEVHKFMNLNEYEVGYFIQQVALAAASFGVTDADVLLVATTLMNYFGYKCLPPVAIVAPEKEAQSICT